MAIALTLALGFIAFVAMNSARVVLTLYSLTLGAPAAAVGVLGGMFYLFPLLLSWPIGTAADRIPPGRLLAAGAVSGTVSMVLPYFFPIIGVFYVAAAMMGLAIAFYHVTLQNLIGTLSAPDRRVRNFSNFSMVGAATNFVGPLVAGFAIDHGGYDAGSLATVGISALAIVLLALGWRLLPTPPPKTPAPAAGEDMPADPGIWRMLVVSAMVQLGTDIFQFYIPIYGHERGMSASAIGSVLASFAVASFVVRLFLPRVAKTMKPEQVLAVSFMFGAIGFMAVPMLSGVVTLGIAAFVFGMGMGCGIPLTLMLMFDRSSAGRSGRTLGLRLASTNAVRVLGPIVLGAIATAFGIASVFWVSALLMSASGVLSRRGNRPA